MPRERVAALGIGALAVVAGGFSLLLVGAPVGLAVRNLIAFAAGIGLGCLGQFLQPRETAFWPRFVLTCLMLSLVLIVGTTIGGVSRWLDFGLFTLQPGLILLPTLLTTLSQDHTGWRRAALLLAVILIAFQPDAATLTALALAMTVMLRVNVKPPALVTALIAVAFSLGAWLTLRNPDPVAFVEGTVQLAVQHGPVAIAVHAATMVLMLAPFLIVRKNGGLENFTFFALLALAAVVAAFPMPLAGSAVSPLVGYGAALALLTIPVRSRFAAPFRRAQAASTSI